MRHPPRRAATFASLGTGLAAALLALAPAPRLAAQETATPAGAPLPLAVETFDAAWGVIHRRHFDTTFGGTDWVALRDTLRPRAAAARDVEELRAVIRDMIGRLRLSHYALLAQDAAAALAPTTAAAGNRPGTIGVDVRIAEGALVIRDVTADGPAAKAGIARGWELVRIDTVDVRALVARRAAGLDERHLAYRAAASAGSLLQGAAGSTVTLVLRDGRGREVRKRVERAAVPGVPVNFGHLPTMYADFASRAARTPAGARVGVLRFNVWMPVLLPRIDAAVDSLRDADGLVFDLRGNPGGVAAMVMGSAGHLLDTVVVLGVMTSREATLRFVSNPRRVSTTGARVTPFAGPVAVLVDEMSASTSEFFAAALQSIGRARVFGQRTSGQALPAQLTKLPNGDVLYHAVADFTTPTGVRLEKDGVVPDEAVPLRRADLLQGRDPALDAALRWIEAQPKGAPRRP